MKARAKKKITKRMVPVLIRFSPMLKQQLEDLAKHEYLTVSQLVRVLCSKAIADAKEKREA